MKSRMDAFFKELRKEVNEMIDRQYAQMEKKYSSIEELNRKVFKKYDVLSKKEALRNIVLDM
jgi:hypothetical protein